MRKHPLRMLTGAALLVMLVLVFAFNAINLEEAYGDGPPYYARTTNMDKWTDPLPMLGIVDGAMLVAIGAYFFWIRRRR
ncbi:hypothetical protein EGY31_08135 [Burkholderia multivorans]|uniref:hypothetical protein n=1 Tax=Burkholderia ubonensis TaxID=101571 RepID=UPI0007564844|nr:hypothetical protein [Burkholderia ubonensis]AYZ63201.1 hypothetical protein EGY31_08135 [Burkholderia multivorans]KUZ78059.1 hypothetical protein WI37_12930 [Burkholderia ubonensis]KVA13257.1 hypothetical protein WI42_21630 [Burkholderia ubonensis]KVA18838.1 hypothetical protein WI43_18330 [Burkholderia ubonensis]KVA47924.1 hypothetical protein WI46_02990 [Burkholderia ubonensis]